MSNIVKVVTNSTATTTYNYSPTNALLSSSGGNSYTYDKNGNRLTQTGAWVLGYNIGNDLKIVTQNGINILTYQYDGIGNLVQKTSSGASQTFVMQASNMLFTKDTQTSQELVYADGILLANVKSGSPEYEVTDLLGSVRASVNGTTGSVNWQTNYSPDGFAINSTGSQTFRFNGKYSGAGGLNFGYYGGRWYDPQTSQWVTEDPMKYTTVSDPSSWNRYLVDSADPVNLVDLDGHMYARPGDGGAGYRGGIYAPPASPSSTTTSTTTTGSTTTTTTTTSSSKSGLSSYP